jgi:hypothetical protein
MTLLLSSPETYASWNWEIEEESDDNLDHAARAAVSIAGILKKHELLNFTQMKISWHRWGSGPVGVRSLISVHEGPDVSAEDLTRMVAASQPVGYTDTYAGRLELIGPGVWINAAGEKKREQELVGVSLSVDESGIYVILWVIHDIWSWYDFSGRPHPEVYHNNAPRLTAALKEIEAALGVETEEGEETYFAVPEKYGIATPTTAAEGAGFDATGRL